MPCITNRRKPKVKNDVAYRLFASGTGTEDDPYVIKGANHWNNMVRMVNAKSTDYTNAYYKLAADVDENGSLESIDVTRIQRYLANMENPYKIDQYFYAKSN